MTVAAKSTGTAVRKPARSEPFRRAEATAGASSPLRIAEDASLSPGAVASPSTRPIPRRTPGPVATRCQGLGYRIAKRALDLPVTLVLTVLALPVMAVVALTIYITSPGPALFRQQRLGRDGKPFPCLKFRSMRTDAEKVLMSDPDLYERYRQNGYKLPAEEDPRIHPVGAFLRRTSLDELPQLFNVLAGHMSPRRPEADRSGRVGGIRGGRGQFSVGLSGHHRVVAGEWAQPTPLS